MRLISLVVVLLVGGSAFAQTSPSPTATQQALSWLQGEWTVAKKEGRAAADRIVREYPQKFKAVKAQVARLTDVAGQVADSNHWAEKKELILELWRVRGSLDLLALCSPDVIHQITGLDTGGLTKLQDQVSHWQKKLGG